MTSAKQVPAIVAAHQEFLLTPQYQVFMHGFFRSVMKNRKKSEDWDEPTILKFADNWRQQEHDVLNVSSLFHVSESMVEVAKVAAQKLPAGSSWTLDTVPARNGVLVFEKSLRVTDVWNRTMKITAITWAWDVKNQCFRIVHYNDPTDLEDAYTQAMVRGGALPENTGPWQTSHVEGAGGEIGAWLTDHSELLENYRRTHQDEVADLIETEEEILPENIPTFGNVQLLVYAIFALMDQTIVSLSEETDRKLIRRFRNKKRPPAMVTVIQLRRKEYHGYHEKGTGTWLTYRSVTRGHWRMQPYGRGRSEIKRIWISPYIRGPEDAPIWQPKRVSTLAR